MLIPNGRGLAVLELGKREHYEHSNREATSAGCVLREPKLNRARRKCIGSIGDE